MSAKLKKLRICFALVICVSFAVGAVLLPQGEAQQLSPEQICALGDDIGTGCDQFDSGSSEGGNNNSATPTPTPTPSPTPTPDPQQEHDDALAAAVAAIGDELRAPGWRAWPNQSVDQVVGLETFLLVNDNWDTHKVERTVGAVTVTVFAEPKRSHWTLTETITANTHEFTCEGAGSEWTTDAIDAECGWTPAHTTEVTGDVNTKVQIEFDLYWESSYLGTSSTFDTRRSRVSADRDLTVTEVQTFGYDQENGAPPLDGAGFVPGSGDTPDGSVPGESDESDNPFPSGLPISTETCSVVGEVGAGILIADLDTRLGFELIIETYADGTQVVTIAGDTGVGLGTDVPSLGAAITVNDSALGAYYKAEAQAWGTIGAGAVYVLDPGDSVQDLLIDLAIDKGTGPLGEGINFVGGFFGQQPIPEAPDSDALFVDVALELEGEVTAVAGAGHVQSAVGVSGQAGINIAGKKYADGRYSVITTFTGEINGQLKNKIEEQGLPGFEADVDEQGIEIKGQLQGEFQVEVIFDEDGNMIEAIVNTSYGWDGDILVGDENDDPFTITNQSWTIDLTDEDARNAFLYDLDIPDMLDTYGTTEGSQEFTVEDNTTTIAIGADLAIVEGGGKLEWGCTTAS